MWNVLWLVGLMIGASVKAEELTIEQETLIFKMAQEQVKHKYPLPEKPPVLHYLTQKEIKRMYGHPAYALSLDNDIYLDETIDYSIPGNAAILAHEYIHYLQFLASGPLKKTDPRVCYKWKERETEAYEIQIQILENQHLDSRPPKSGLQYIYTIRCP